ncbi:MAG: alpha-galactosidase, partial [Clostridia bacterium]|nr:alpha-galactosidase [Clostridia bacterium]
FTFDTETIKGIIDATSGLGIDTFVMDDGWFGKRNDDKTSLGDWFVNEEKLRGGLKPVIDYCKSKNLKFGLWIEPEMISEKSELYAAHPEFAVGKRGNEPSRSRTQLVLDFSNDEIVDYIYGVIDKILTENDISYVKWDMNRDLTDFYSETLGYDRQGEFSHRYALGVYRLAEKLTTSHPEVFFEGCAGGGGRFDGGMLYYFPQIWTSDNTDAADRAKIQYGTSFCYPLSAMSCHVSVCPNHQTSRITPFNTRRLVASLGATGYELDPRKLSGEERETVKGQIEDYEKISELVLKGDLYRLKDPFEGEAFAFAVVSKDKKEAYVVYEAMKSNYVTVKKRLKIAGLAPDAEYEIAETGVRTSGKAFALYGVALPKMADYEGFSLHLRKL